jgi:hypothetical protein
LRAIVWHDTTGKPLNTAHYFDFCIIWDEDHDTRVIKIAEKAYINGFLNSMLFLGERKGIFTAVLDHNFVKNAPKKVESIYGEIFEWTRDVDNDTWPVSLVSIRNSDFQIHAGEEQYNLISDSLDNVMLYLANINMLFKLGIKPIEMPLTTVYAEV